MVIRRLNAVTSVQENHFLYARGLHTRPNDVVVRAYSKYRLALPVDITIDLHIMSSDGVQK